MRCDWTATNSTSKSNKRTRALVPFLSLLICIAAGSVSAQKTPQPAGGGMTTQPGPGGPGQQSGGANAANAPNNGPQGGGSTGIEPIEASILAYRLLGATSHVIAQAVDSAVQNGDTLLVVSSSDLSAILQWRTVVGQIEDLQDRLNLDNGLYSNLALYQPPQTLHPSVVERGKFSAPVSLTDLSTLVQMIPTLASAFAVNEAATSSQGSVPDEPLMATVAANLKSANKTTFVPSDYTPNLMAGADLGDGVLSLQLGKLEEARETCEENIEKVVRQFGEALSAVRAGGKEDKQDAAKYLADSLAAKAFVASCTADIQAIDLFEGTLFSGQTPAAQANAPPNGGGNANTGAPAPAAQAAQVGGLGSGGQSVQMTSWNAPGTTLQSILSADLLMRKVLGSPKSIPKVIQSNKLYILAVHVLESGGEEFTSSNIFTGTKVRFGGGLAAAFAVYHLDGTIACAGVAVAYRGDVSSGDVEKMMKSAPAISDMPLSSYSVCADVQK